VSLHLQALREEAQAVQLRLVLGARGALPGLALRLRALQLLDLALQALVLLLVAQAHARHLLLHAHLRGTRQGRHEAGSSGDEVHEKG